MPAGRPSDYSVKTADEICEQLSDGRSLRDICKSDDMPNRATVFRWLHQFPEFHDQYAHAREVQAEYLFDDIIDIADDGTNDWMERKNADGDNIGWQTNGEALQRSKLRVDARKWAASKMLPKKYGDKLDIDQRTTIVYPDHAADFAKD